MQSRLLRLTIIVGLVSLTIVNGQQRSRQEAIKEAARLATEAERVQGASKTGNSATLRESEKFAAESFEKAIELWREAGHDERLKAGVQELSRIYFILGDYDRVVDRLTREAEYWRQRGDIAAQAEMLFSLGIRQGQMKREAAAIETLERVLEVCRSAHLQSLEPNALTQLAALYDKVGRAKDAESSRESAKLLWSAIASERPRAVLPRRMPPATIPAQWVDLPGAPAAAEYRVIEGVNEAVLVNRSSKGIEMVSVGCVALEDDRKVRVLHGLVGESLNHGGVRPGSYYRPFNMLNGPKNRWSDEKMGCEGAAKIALIEAQFDDRTTWKADGIEWTR